MDVRHIHLPTARVVHDGQPEMPFWGWPTSTIDWCEESTYPLHLLPTIYLRSLELTVLQIDYKISPYIAEFANTVTNAFFSKPLQCPELSLTFFQFPWRRLDFEIQFGKSITRGSLQQRWDSCL